MVAGGARAAPAVPGLPPYYPPEYARIVEASRGEDGPLVYSIMSARNWEPVLAEFRRLYPWIRVETLDLGSHEVFERYYAESAGGGCLPGVRPARPGGGLRRLHHLRVPPLPRRRACAGMGHDAGRDSRGQPRHGHVIFSYDPDLADRAKIEAFLSRWKRVYGR